MKDIVFALIKRVKQLSTKVHPLPKSPRDVESYIPEPSLVNITTQ
jgi:hypothetical protein